jgi:hypothetical protein
MKINKNKVLITVFSLIFILITVFSFHLIKKNDDFFSIIVLPDTQKYSYEYPEIFCKQTEWIIKNKKKFNILFVSHVGDIVQSGAINNSEWETASKCMKKLEGIVPYGIIPGNHDADKVDDPDSSFLKYNTIFSPLRFKKYSWYKGFYKGNQNNYQLINVNKNISLLFMNLQVDPTDNDIEWANQILKKNYNSWVIFTTHAYQYDNTKKRSEKPHFRKNGNSGEAIWNKLIKENCNIILTISGHFHQADGENYFASYNKCGKVVHQFVQNYQDRIKGGNGLLRIYNFFPKKNKIIIKTYSVIDNKYEKDFNSDFILDLF